MGTFWVSTPRAGGGAACAKSLRLAAERAGYAGDDTAEAAEALIAARAEARAAKDWAVADAIRDALGELGLVVEDTAGRRSRQGEITKGWVASSLSAPAVRPCL